MSREIKHLIFRAIFEDLGLRNKDLVIILERKKPIISMYLSNTISIPEFVLMKVCEHYNVDLEQYKTKILKDKKDARFGNKKYA